MAAFEGQLVSSRDGHNLLRLDGYPIAGGETKISPYRQSSISTDVEPEIFADCLGKRAANGGLLIGADSFIHFATDSYLIIRAYAQSFRLPDGFSSIAAYCNGLVISNGFVLVVFNDGSPIACP